MSDYAKSRPAKVGEKLRTHRFHPGIIGFAAPGNTDIAIRILPGTELAFASAIKCSPRGFGLFGWKLLVLNHTTATFRQVNKYHLRTQIQASHPDAPTSPKTSLVEGHLPSVNVNYVNSLVGCCGRWCAEIQATHGGGDASCIAQ
jgi:hypothetical protein